MSKTKIYPVTIFTIVVFAVLLFHADLSAQQSENAGLVRLSQRAWGWVARDDRSSNSALFVGDTSALIVDPGLTPAVARQFLAAVHKVTDKPIRWAVLTHWHPDHSLGAVCLEDREFGLIAHPKTRSALAEHLAQVRSQFAKNTPNELGRADLLSCRFRLPEETVADKKSFDLGGHRIEVFHPGAAHTWGDLAVWSADEKVLVTGDLFLHDSSPSMGEGSVLVWIEALQQLAALAPEAIVPGHFAIAQLSDMQRFQSYLQAQVDHARAAITRGATVEEASGDADFPAFANFLQYPQYQATFADNARVVMTELQNQPAEPGDAGGFRIAKVLRIGRAPHQISFSADGATAFIAAAGSDSIAIIDAVSQTLKTKIPVANTPLGVIELPGGDLAVSSFRGDRVQRISPQHGETGEFLLTGAAPSLFSAPLPGEQYLISAEGANVLWLLRAKPFELLNSYATGKRPFPPSATSDGRLAFVPNYDDGTVTVIDLWNERRLAVIPVGEHPSGGAVLPGDIDYAVAVRGQNRVAFINTASRRVVDHVTEGIGSEPFSVLSSTDGRFAFVNNTASHDVSVISLPDRRIVARIPVGKIPITMAVHPSGATLWVACEGSHEVDIIDIPAASEALTQSDDTKAPITEVLILGMIHGKHRTSEKWGLQQLSQTIQRIAPDVIACEIPPDRWRRIWRDWSERGVIEDPRVKRFPEYTDVLLPLKIQMGFDVEPCAGWTKEMSDLRETRIEQFSSNPKFANAYQSYEKENELVTTRHAAHAIDEEDPHVIHSAVYDQRTKEKLTPYDKYMNDLIGPGGWRNINEAHYRLIDRAIRRNPGKRILITFGAGHKYWLLEKLRQRTDIKLVEVAPFLPQRLAGHN